MSLTPSISMTTSTSAVSTPLTFTKKHLWEYPVLDIGCNDNADSCTLEEFLFPDTVYTEYKKLKDEKHLTLQESLYLRYRNPVHFEWQENCPLFKDDDVPYSGDVVFLHFMGNYSLWVKIDKKDEEKMKTYLKSIDLIL